jgi:hypothetical protein
VSSILTQVQGDELSLRFDPVAGAEADVGAVAFAESIILAVRALRQTATLLAEGRRLHVQYEIADLTHSSPATAVLQARVSRQEAGIVNRAQQQFVQAIQIINDGGVPDFLDYPTLRTYKELGNVARKGGFVNRVRLNGSAADISAGLKDRLDLELSKDQFMVGTIRGTLKSYSTEGRNLLRIFPRTSPPVTCEFRSKLKERASRLVEQDVEVVGKMRYRPNAYHPYYMYIKDINPASRPTGVISLASLRGMPTTPAEGASSEDLIREQRRAW